MNPRHSFGFVAWLSLATLFGGSAAFAENPSWWADNDRQGPPGANDKPPDTDDDTDRWTPGSTSADFTLKGGRYLYIGIPNDDEGGTKYVFVQIDADSGLGQLKAPRKIGKGFNGANARSGSLLRYTPSTNGKVAQLQGSFPDCPEWEYLKLENAGAEHAFKNVTMWAIAWCEGAARAGSHVIGDTRVGCGCDGPGPEVAITEIYDFPISVPFDPGVPPTLIAPPASGPWFAEFPVFETPEGDPRPLGGVRWFSLGPGMSLGDVYTFDYAMIGDADMQYEVFAYDLLTDRYGQYERDLRPRIVSTISRHSTSSSLGMSLEPFALGDASIDADPDESLLPTVDPRDLTDLVISIDFNQPVTLIDPGAVTISDGEVFLPITAVTLVDLDTRLNVNVVGSLPNAAAYRIDVAGAIEDLTGDTDYSFVLLTGDGDGDGRVTDDDVTLINAHLGEPADDTNVHVDLDIDGFITPNDAMIAQDRIGDSVICPGSFPTVPWYEDFEDYDPGLGLHGGCGWKGWDDDPAFDAPATDAESNSGSNAVDIKLDADLVNEYLDFEDGPWSYSGWQYIPSEFESGGTGDLDGTYFLLLNTYNDGGPYNWSAQMQFDSNDGLCKVFHGDDVNTIDVPYETDRWVKIQVIIDLDDDWTRIYYDDELVTQYTWTGGVLGEGGGALDIAAVDLYANGSTSVYYDDLALEPITSGCGSDLEADADVDGLDLLGEFLAGTDPCDDDTDDDGFIDGIDNCPSTWNPDQEDSNDDGIGDVCTEPVACAADLDGNGTVGVVELLAILAAWGECPGCPEDLDDNGFVDVGDLLDLLAAWGDCS